MKRILLSVLVIGLLAGQAFAGMYVLDKSTALTFSFQGKSSGDVGDLLGVTTNPVAYNPPPPYIMKGAVGYLGYLWPSPPHTYATLKIGAGDNAGLSSTYTDGYGAFLANDDDDAWDVRLYVTTGSGTVYSNGGSFTPLPFHSALTWFTVAGPIDFSHVTDFGLEIGTNRFDGFHVSAVPVPGAVVLGALGLMAAGLKLRRLGSSEADRT